MSDSTGAVPDKGEASASLACKDIKQLEMIFSRAGSILYQTWLSFREQTWNPHMSNITSIQDRGSSLTCHFGPTSKPKDNWFCKFPEQSLTSREHAKEMLLNYCRCNDPYAYLYSLAEKLFHGLFSNLNPSSAC